MKLRRLLHALHPCYFGQHLDEQAGFVQQFESAARLALGEHFGEFVANALAAHRVDAGSQGAHGRGGLRFEHEAEPRREAHRAQQAKLVFFKAPAGFADGADDAGIEIRQPAHVIQKSCAHGETVVARVREPGRIKQQSVDGEVAALHVVARRRGVADLVGVAAIGVHAVGTERCDLGDAALGHRALFAPCAGFGRDQHNAEVRADGKSARKHLEHDVGSGGRGHVVVHRLAAEQQVANASAGEISFVAAGAQRSRTMWRAASNWGVLEGICVYCHSPGRPRSRPIIADGAAGR